MVFLCGRGNSLALLSVEFLLGVGGEPKELNTLLCAFGELSCAFFPSRLNHWRNVGMKGGGDGSGEGERLLKHILFLPCLVPFLHESVLAPRLVMFDNSCTGYAVAGPVGAIVFEISSIGRDDNSQLLPRFLYLGFEGVALG